MELGLVELGDFTGFGASDGINAEAALWTCGRPPACSRCDLASSDSGEENALPTWGARPKEEREDLHRPMAHSDELRIHHAGNSETIQISQGVSGNGQYSEPQAPKTNAEQCPNQGDTHNMGIRQNSSEEEITPTCSKKSYARAKFAEFQRFQPTSVE